MGISTIFCVDINRGVRNFQDTPGAVLLDVPAPQLYARRHIRRAGTSPSPSWTGWGISCRTTTSPSSSAPTAGEISAKATDRLKAMGHAPQCSIGA